MGWPLAAVRPRPGSRALGISRAPLREALRRLDEEGFVEPTGRSGFAVAELNPETIRETYEVRLSLESSAMRYAFDRTPFERGG